MTKRNTSKPNSSAKSTLPTASAGFKIRKRQPSALDIVIENANVANRCAINQNVGAPVGDNLVSEDHIDDREVSDHEDDLVVNTTSRPTDDSDEESEIQRFLAYHFRIDETIVLTNASLRTRRSSNQIEYIEKRTIKIGDIWLRKN